MAIPNPNPNIEDGIICDNKTLSSSKIKAVVDAVTEAYDDALGAVDAKFNYSTDEVAVGSWIDDSVIYQKTIKLENQTIPKNDALVITVADIVADMDMLIDWYIICDTGSDVLVLPYEYGATAFATFITSVAASKTAITISRGNSNDLTGDLYITIKYTKTA